MKKFRDIVTIDDLTNKEIEDIFDLAEEFLLEMGEETEKAGELPYRIKGRHDLAKNFVIATLFYEPSTRTKFSFESE